MSKAIENSSPAQKLSEAGDLTSTDEKNIISTPIKLDEINVQEGPSSYSEERQIVSRACASEEDDLSILLYSSRIGISVGHSKRKLLILDLNGLLADIVSHPPRDFKAGIKIGRKTIFIRPFCLDFLRFCFESFKVGVWSSRSRPNVEKVTDFLMGDMKHELLFCWDLSHCTATRFKTLENKHKPLVFKELRKFWEKQDLNLPFEKQYYNEYNTLLLDDSPYKSLLNHPQNAIFPYPYKYHNRSDTSLGAGGDIRVYLEELAAAKNVQEFVDKHPFGQGPISETSASWSFYLQVINSLHSSQV